MIDRRRENNCRSSGNTLLHSSFIVRSGLIEAAAGLIMAEKPDLIVLTGAFISGSTGLNLFPRPILVKFLLRTLVNCDMKIIEKVLELRGKVRWEGDLAEMRRGRSGTH